MNVSLKKEGKSALRCFDHYFCT